MIGPASYPEDPEVCNSKHTNYPQKNPSESQVLNELSNQKKLVSEAHEIVGCLRDNLELVSSLEEISIQEQNVPPVSVTCELHRILLAHNECIINLINKMKVLQNSIAL